MSCIKKEKIGRLMQMYNFCMNLGENDLQLVWENANRQDDEVLVPRSRECLGNSQNKNKKFVEILKVVFEK